jgi:4-hydroxybutyrate dehydrogenase
MSESIPIAVMSFPTRMVVGPGAVGRLGDEVRRLNARRVLVVSDRGVEAAGILARALGQLAGDGLPASSYLGVSKNPKESDVLDGVAAYRAAGAELIVGLGGGAPMDVAKAIALKVTHEQPLAVYDDLLDGWQKIRADMPPVIAIPTTAGTGSEVGRSSVVCLGEDGHKVVIFSPHMLPKVAICDAELTVGLPAAITAATGVDAMTHALEAYVSNGYHPFADMTALNSLARIGVHLERAVRDGRDLEARHQMLLAASLGAISFQKGLGACHALAHPLGAVADVHHGLANAVMLPHVIRFNLSHATQAYAIAGEALGVRSGGSTEARAQACLERIASLLRSVGIPERLRDVGVTAAMIEPMVAQAVVDAAGAGNPRKLTAEAARALYQAAL